MLPVPLIASEAEDELRRRLESELRPGERLVWWERPNPDVFARRERGMFVFGGVWSLFFSGLGALLLVGGDAGAVVVGGVFMIPFLLGGFWMLAAPRRARKRAAHTIYGITERRALSITALADLEVRSFHSNDLGKVKRVEHQDGSGDLILRQDLKSDGDGTATLSEAGFFGITDVRRVERLLDDVRTRVHRGAA